MQRRMRARSIRMTVAVFALSLSLTACDPQSLVSTFFGFFSGTGLEAPAGQAPEADADDPAADEVADDDAGDRKHHRKDDGAGDDAPAEDEAPADDAGDAAAGLSAIEQEIFDTLNATRADAGLAELDLSADIAAGARDYSCTMAETGVFEHADIAAAGVNGENIAAGQQSAAQVHRGWMESPGHRDNRMNERWTEYGVGVCEDDGGRRYYTERFR